MATIFSKIVAGEIPCHRVFETEHCLAFLDINPIARGHVLCIPKQEVDYICDLDDEALCELQLFAKRVARGLKKVCPCIKVAQAVIGVDVPHVHIHLIPMQSEGDADFRREKLKLTPEQFEEAAAKIRENF